MVEIRLRRGIGGANDTKLGRIARGGGAGGKRLMAVCARDEFPIGVWMMGIE